MRGDDENTMLIGHEKIVEDLKKLAAKHELAHGYIFFGSSMVGKRTMALQFANFLETGEFAEPALLHDALLLAPDEKGTLGIDAVRTLKSFLWQKPNVSRYRTAIVDGGEFMTDEAQNALLKIAEEPPQSSLLILVTSDAEGLLPTISSRLQKVYFPAVSEKSIAAWLVQNFKLTGKAAEELAKRSFGKPGFAAAMLRDKDFQEILKSAENLLKLSQEKRRDFVKKLMNDDDFDFAKLLDALIIQIASQGISTKESIVRWHKFLALRHDVAYFNLNPKLQLENLFN